MKILHLCTSDLAGGAARAAFRLHQAQRKAGIESFMLVVNKASDDPFVLSVSKTRFIFITLANAVRRFIVQKQKTSNTTLHSINFFSSGLHRVINKLKPDIVNLHWICGEMLAIQDVKKIKAPIVWTMHDMWAFCGSEHYGEEGHDVRFEEGYTPLNRPDNHTGLDIDSWTYSRKCKHWSKLRINIVAPSRWLHQCVSRSKLLSNQDVKTISNCIDHRVFKPLDKRASRNMLNLPVDKKLILFGAFNSTSDPRKGVHVLRDALKSLVKSDVELVVYGASHGDIEGQTGIKTHYLGVLHDEFTLAAAYSAADVFVAPSLQDNLPNTLVESLACGTRCIAFDIGGMRDLIPNDKFGQLVSRINSEDLTEAISQELSVQYSPSIVASLSAGLRDEKLIVKSYLEIYKKAITDYTD
ncbi:glycosyltransferase [Alteromonas macleodii]|uniref:glycosyltransferase n=1 Tax=Alteromonas TaxID=226 RepID=UPI000C5D6C14|nr:MULTISPECIES: glycosyltransferase [Alteromonas]MBE91060.1 glycosyl transferase [Rhodospirillaceae bacterium]MCZ4240937.1 glycosyltransferase [Alteromonas macleodii]